MTRKLKPVRRLRRTRYHACGNCRHGWHQGDGSFVCERPGGKTWDSGDGMEWLYVCSRWRKQND